MVKVKGMSGPSHQWTAIKEAKSCAHSVQMDLQIASAQIQQPRDSFRHRQVHGKQWVIDIQVVPVLPTGGLFEVEVKAPSISVKRERKRHIMRNHHDVADSYHVLRKAIDERQPVLVGDT